jgi:hypothetical protein
MEISIRFLKRFFESGAVKISLCISVFFYFLLLADFYFDEVNRIDKIAVSKFGEEISPQMTFAEVLASADIAYVAVFFKVLLVVFVPAVALVHLVRKNILKESHPGWRRLNIVVPPVLAIIIIMAFGVVDFSMFIFIFIVSSLGALSAVAVARWVLAGFRKA